MDILRDDLFPDISNSMIHAVRFRNAAPEISTVACRDNTDIYDEFITGLYGHRTFVREMCWGHVESQC